MGERTVRRHLDQLVRELGISGRDEPYAEAARRGRLDADSDASPDRTRSGPCQFVALLTLPGLGWSLIKNARRALARVPG